MKNPQMLKIFLVFILSTAYIFSFSHFGASAYNQIFKDSAQFGENTTIGSLDIEGQSKREVSTLLSEATEKWTQNTVLGITYKEGQMTVDNGIFNFQREKTVVSLLSGKKNKAVVSVDKDSLLEDLYDMSLSLASTTLDIDRLANDLAVSAEFLTEGTKTLELENYIDGDVGEDEVIAEATVNVGDAATAIKELIPLIQPMEVKGETQFSLLQKMSELEGKKYNSDTLSRLATAIYGVVLPTNFTILERNISDQLPGYAKLGFEAHIDSEIGHDLVFANTNDHAYRVELQVEGKKLKATLKGQSFLNSYEVKTTDEKRYTPKTIKQYSDELAPAAMQVKKDGKDGITVKVLRRIESSAGDLRRRKPYLKISMHRFIELKYMDWNSKKSFHLLLILIMKMPLMRRPRTRKKTIKGLTKTLGRIRGNQRMNRPMMPVGIAIGQKTIRTSKKVNKMVIKMVIKLRVIVSRKRVDTPNMWKIPTFPKNKVKQG